MRLVISKQQISIVSGLHRYFCIVSNSATCQRCRLRWDKPTPICNYFCSLLKGKLRVTNSLICVVYHQHRLISSELLMWLRKMLRSFFIQRLAVKVPWARRSWFWVAYHRTCPYLTLILAYASVKVWQQGTSKLIWYVIKTLFYSA